MFPAFLVIRSCATGGAINLPGSTERISVFARFDHIDEVPGRALPAGLVEWGRRLGQVANPPDLPDRHQLRPVKKFTGLGVTHEFEGVTNRDQQTRPDHDRDGVERECS